MSTPLQIETMMQKAEMEHTSLMDGLTGVFNRRFLEIRFRELQKSAIRHYRFELMKSKEKNKTFSCVMIDIDNFKEFNDKNSYTAGDEVLKHVARCIEDALRSGDTVGRYGGEEFLVLADEANGHSNELAERLRTLIENMEVVYTDGSGEHKFRVTISLGVSPFILQPDIDEINGMQFSHMQHGAGSSLHAAKSGGRNQVWYYDLQEKVSKRYTPPKEENIATAA